MDELFDNVRKLVEDVFEDGRMFVDVELLVLIPLDINFSVS